MPLISTSLATVVPYFAAIRDRVSPLFTVYVPAAWVVGFVGLSAVPPDVPPSFRAIMSKSGVMKPRIYRPFTFMVRLPTLPPFMFPSVTTKVPPPTLVTMPM